MSLSLNGVEVNKLSLNGVEISNGYLNGVEVFTSSRGIVAVNHGGYLIELDEGVTSGAVTPTLGSGASADNYSKLYTVTESFYVFLVTVSGSYYLEKIDFVTGSNLGRSPVITDVPFVVIYNSKDGYIYAIGRNNASKILASDMTTSLMNVAISPIASASIDATARLSKDGDYIYYNEQSNQDNLYRLKCLDLTKDTLFYDGDTLNLGDIQATCPAKDGYVYLISNTEYMYKIDPSTMTSVNFPDGSSRHGVFLSGQVVEALDIYNGYAYIGYTNGMLRKTNLYDGTPEYTVTTALDGESGDRILHIVVDGAYVYCAVAGAGTSQSKLIDVRDSGDLSLVSTINLGTTYGNWGVRSLSFKESPYDTLNS